MSIATLLEIPTPQNLAAWEFEHSMAHRYCLGAMAAPIDVLQIGGIYYPSPTTGGLSRFTGVPYLLDPMSNSGAWHRNHDQAHQDYALTLPAYYEWTGTGTQGPTQNFADTSLADPSQLTWWTHANHQQHLIAVSTISELTFPFW